MMPAEGSMPVGQHAPLKLVEVVMGMHDSTVLIQQYGRPPRSRQHGVKNITLAMGRDPEQGAYSALYASLSNEIVEKDYNGAYFSDPVRSLFLLVHTAPKVTGECSDADIVQGQLGGETAQALDTNLATALWELSERMVKRIVGDDALNKW
jgi:hypothetical protein